MNAQSDQADLPSQGGQPIPGPGAIKDPEDWKTGGEPITDAQLSYIQTLAQQAKVDVDTEGMTKAKAAECIEELQEKTGRKGGSTQQAGGS